MLTKKLIRIGLSLFLCLSTGITSAQPEGDGIGQTIQIYTRFHSFVGKSSWLLVIRDLDHDQNIPYWYDIRKGDNFWLAFTYGRNYVISASNLQIETYTRYNTYKKYKITDFCHLESHGRIIRGESLYITIDGDLSPNRNTYTCHVSSYTDTNFTVVPQDPAD